ncbi:hypothetical protein HYH03_008875 [Edaphochlamys debaryana]|uniref:W2 domain-containing protein n=1 Tax=Edaphochlamys debaryana TaxID=47281 RepID=A0A835Y1J5_9CHLO|nr:hypothetical protein HYH03_008875 [Edaphochlamys debaryana]|eukprot:KAG2492968.1 hypothetical protein HYH03_008875 [Edaphochlamys debaryana]
MGAQGLTSLLQRNGRPRIVSLKNGEAAQRRDRLVVLDLSPLMYHLAQRHHPGDHKALYAGALAFMGGLLRAGLRVVAVADSATAPGTEETYVARRRAGGGLLPTVEPVVLQACADLAAAANAGHEGPSPPPFTLLRSAHGADELALAFALGGGGGPAGEELFALLTDDSDFYVWGVRRVAHIGDLVLDSGGLTLALWDSEELWRGWVAAVGGIGPMLPGLRRRAEVAAALGTDLWRGLRSRLESRLATTAPGGTAPAGGAAAGPRRHCTPGAAAKAVLMRDGDVGGGPYASSAAGPSAEFFKRPPIGISLTDEDLREFSAVVKFYVDAHQAAKSGQAVTALSLTPDSLPWLAAPVRRRLAASAPVPSLLTAAACRGFCANRLPGPLASEEALRALRCAAAARLLPAAAAPGPAYEYCAATHQLLPLTSAGGAANGANGGGAAKEWFVPGKDLPGVPLAAGAPPAPPAALAELLAAPLGPDPAATAARIAAAITAALPAPADGAVANGGTAAADASASAAADAALLASLAPFYALLLHGADPSEDAAVWDAAAVRRLLLPGVAAPPPAAGGLEPLLAAAAALGGLGHEAEEEEEEEQAALEAAAAAAGVVVSVGSALNKDDWEEIDDKEVVGRVRAGPGYALMDKLQPALPREQEGPGAGGAAAAGPGSPEWTTAQRDWSAKAPATRARLLEALWSSNNRPAARRTAEGHPTRYPHQQEILELIDGHLTAGESCEHAPASWRPLHIILSTPTGSGKTFTAVMLHLQLLRQKHPEAVLVYTVPTKQVLKRVGQECEAHRVVYWTAARDGDLFQVRRPYSVRSQRNKGGSAGTGTMKDQLEACSLQAVQNKDLGGGKPGVIIADVHATAALAAAGRQARRDAFYAAKNLVLYLDEPNMGLGLDSEVRTAVRSVLSAAPPTTVLASATLAPWAQLPGWWRGGAAGGGATRVTITQEPYDLPVARLHVYDSTSGLLSAALSPLELLRGEGELAAVVGAGAGGRRNRAVLLLRHFTPQQCNELLGLCATADGEEDDSWRLLDMDIRTLRSELLEPELAALAEAPQRAQALAEAWARRQAASKAPRLADVRGTLGSKGVTLVATLSPRDVALSLAGREDDPAKWAEERRELRARVRAAAAAKRSADKARDRAAKRGDGGAEDERGGPGLDTSGAGRVSLRPGLAVWADEADDVADDDTLLMLARGVAYAASAGVEPLVKRVYQQALLYVPERPGAVPPIHTLVVDYSAIYGTDCPAVDTLILMPDLGALLGGDDHTQLLGRLRRDGAAVYPDAALLRAALLGAGPGAAEADRRRAAAETQAAVEAVLAKHVHGGVEGAEAEGADATKAAAKELRGLVRTGVTSLGDVGGCVLRAVLGDLLRPAPPLSPNAAASASVWAPKALLDAAKGRLAQWGRVRPLALLEALRLERAQEQRRLLEALAELCGAAGAGAGGGAGAGAEGGEGGAVLLKCVVPLLQELADEALLEEGALGGWGKAAPGQAAAGVGGGGRGAASPAAQEFGRAVGRILEYVKESEDEEEEDEE